MIYTLMTRNAMRIAYKAHENQKDKSGVPYIFHPYHVAEQMDDEVSCVVALLHDVVEDTHITMEMLEWNFPQEVVQPLKLMTHDKNTPYMDYIKNLSKDRVAKKVKLADLEHNMDESRMVGSGENIKQIERRRKKYQEAWEYLKYGGREFSIEEIY